jgi:TPR repeat protein
MCNLGHWYEYGLKGLAEDLAKAVEWYEKSHEAGHAGGTCYLGLCYLLGNGVPKCPMRANTLLSDAAARSIKVACYNLGRAYADGLCGFPMDKKMARRYYSMVASASIDDLTGDAKEKTATWLREHPAA